MKYFKYFIQYLLIPLLILLVAGFQICQKRKGLSSWKGGGFGMYADYYPLTFEIRVNNEVIILDKYENYEQYALGRKIMFYPKECDVEDFISTLKIQKDTIKLEIWQPCLESKTLKFKKSNRYEKIFFKAK